MLLSDGEIRVNMPYAHKLAFKRLAQSKGKPMSGLLREFIYSQMSVTQEAQVRKFNPKKNPSKFLKEYHLRVPGTLNNYLEFDYHARGIPYSHTILEALRTYYWPKYDERLGFIPSKSYTHK